ncbi:MAG: hypothetical protein C5B52_06390 [Bacteroidetes bacterium]|nr:MAG: hypothetical protein C5B52_06390 [Bacteroidota bacterium]
MVSLEDKDFKPDIALDTSIQNWLNSFPEYKNLSIEEQNVYYWVNFMRKDPKRFSSLVLTPFLQEFKVMDNADSRSLKVDLQTNSTLKPLRPNSALIKTASVQAADLGQNGRTISHNSTGGKSFGDRMKEAGIQKCAFENIYSGKKDALEAILLLLIDSGVPNKGHRKALLNADVTSMGASFAPFRAQQNFVLVQDFSCD